MLRNRGACQFVTEFFVHLVSAACQVIDHAASADDRGEIGQIIAVFLQHLQDHVSSIFSL